MTMHAWLVIVLLPLLVLTPQALPEIDAFHSGCGVSQCCITIVFYPCCSSASSSATITFGTDAINDRESNVFLSEQLNSGLVQIGNSFEGLRVKAIRIEWKDGASCIEAFRFTCGANVLTGNMSSSGTPKSVVLGATQLGIRTRVQNHFVHVDSSRGAGHSCTLFGESDGQWIREIGILPAIFDCKGSDDECKARHMYLGWKKLSGA